MNLNLLMDDWNYCNSNIMMRREDTLFHIIEIIKRIHPKCLDITVFTDFSR